ncbi:hypothetical protein TPA0907_29870 [Micromonospora humidisoli]|nr:hypothetical protein TPA0907_29870 [Micromonospora sp. AKA109]
MRPVGGSFPVPNTSEQFGTTVALVIANRTVGVLVTVGATVGRGVRVGGGLGVVDAVGVGGGVGGSVGSGVPGGPVVGSGGGVELAAESDPAGVSLVAVR